jgi:hypothetical protein
LRLGVVTLGIGDLSRHNLCAGALGVDVVYDRVSVLTFRDPLVALLGFGLRKSELILESGYFTLAGYLLASGVALSLARTRSSRALLTFALSFFAIGYAFFRLLADGSVTTWLGSR